MIDTGSEFGARAERRLRDELMAWLVPVSPAGAPQPAPVWFLWDGESVLIYSQPGRPKLRNIERNPHAALHLEGDGRGGDIVILTGEARVSDDPPADGVPEYVAKYSGRIEQLGWTPQSFAADYSVPLRLRGLALRGH